MFLVFRQGFRRAAVDAFAAFAVAFLPLNRSVTLLARVGDTRKRYGRLDLNSNTCAVGFRHEV